MQEQQKPHSEQNIGNIAKEMIFFLPITKEKTPTDTYTSNRQNYSQLMQVLLREFSPFYEALVEQLTEKLC